MTCITTGCNRARIEPTPGGAIHAHCQACEARLLREAFGPVSWHDRARVNELPSLVVGGLPIDPPSSRGDVGTFPQASVPPARQGAERALPVATG